MENRQNSGSVRRRGIVIAARVTTVVVGLVAFLLTGNTYMRCSNWMDAFAFVVNTVGFGCSILLAIVRCIVIKCNLLDKLWIKKDMYFHALLAVLLMVAEFLLIYRVFTWRNEGTWGLVERLGAMGLTCLLVIVYNLIAQDGRRQLTKASVSRYDPADANVSEA